jgi:membrane-associated phospholipid phosphatase
VSTWASTVKDAIRDFDHRASVRLRRLNSGATASALLVFGAFGSDRVFLPAFVLVAAWALWERDFAGALVLALVTLATRQSIFALKSLIGRIRPPISRSLDCSFPSGHTMAGIAVYGTAGEVIARFQPATQAMHLVACADYRDLPHCPGAFIGQAM